MAVRKRQATALAMSRVGSNSAMPTSLQPMVIVMEMTMGNLCIYIPEEQEWESIAPDWAKGNYAYVIEELKKWAEPQQIPVAKVCGSWVDFGQ